VRPSIVLVTLDKEVAIRFEGSIEFEVQFVRNGELCSA